MVIRFDGRNRQAEEWLRTRSGNLIREITDEQRDVIREALIRGMEAGRNPRAVALEIVGRLNRATGQREGGLIGLTSAQSQWVDGARRQLEELDSGYFTRARRDKGFDRTVAKAIREGKALSRADVDKITARYADRLLAFRGEAIARTEGIGALHAAQYEAMRQLVESGKVRADQITKVWSATMDGRTRDTHQAMNGQEAPFFGAFTTPNGALMLHPHDASLGAPASEIINCRCFMQTRIKYL